MCVKDKKSCLFISEWEISKIVRYSFRLLCIMNHKMNDQVFTVQTKEGGVGQSDRHVILAAVYRYSRYFNIDKVNAI